MYTKETTVLYVEDHLETQKVIEKILKKKCKEVYVANNGLEGLNLYQEKEPNIIISDIMMPKLNGIDMSQQIRELNPYQIIGLFTAYSEPQLKEKADLLDIDAYLMKPFDEKQFFTTLDYLCMAFHTDLVTKKRT